MIIFTLKIRINSNVQLSVFVVALLAGSFALTNIRPTRADSAIRSVASSQANNVRDDLINELNILTDKVYDHEHIIQDIQHDINKIQRQRWAW